MTRSIGQQITIEQREQPSYSRGAAVVITAEYDRGFGGFTTLGARGVPMEVVAGQTCIAFLQWRDTTDATCDEHLGDQLVLPAALAAGESRWSVPVVTEHLRTALWVAGQFLPLTVGIEERVGGGSVITVGQIT